MADYKGLCITFEGDSSSLSAALNTINARARVAQGNLTAINSALKFDPTNVGLLQQKVLNLSDAAKASGDRLNGLKSATSNLSATFASASKEAASTKEHYNEYKQEVGELDAALVKNAEAASKNKAALRDAKAPLTELNSQMGTLKESIKTTTAARDALAAKKNLTKAERTELASLNSQLSAQNSQLAKLKGSYSACKSSRSANIRSLENEGRMLETERQSLERLRAEYGDYVSAHDQAVKRRETAAANLKKNQTDIEVEAQRLEQLNAELLQTAGAAEVAGTGVGRFAMYLGTGSSALVTMGGKLEAVGMKLSFFSGILTGTLGREVVNETRDFGNAMSQVGGYLDASKSKLSSLSDLALRVGYETQFSATEAAEAMSDLAKGGMTDVEIKAGGLEASMQLAAAGQLDLASAADITVQAMRAFNLDSNNAMEIADALAGAANASTAEVSDLSSAFSNCSAVCSNAGWSIQETAGAIGELTDHGLSGEQAGTALKVMLQRLQSPTNKASEVMEKYGIEVRDAEGHMKSATEIVDILRDKLGSLDDASRDNALQTMFGTRSSNAALIFMRNGSDELNKYISAASRAGAASDMANAQMGRLGWALEYLRGEAETAEVNLGNALTPTIVELADAAQDLLSKFNALSPAEQALIGKTVLFAAAAGPVLLVGGKVLKLLGTVGGSMSRAIIFTRAFAGTAGYGATMANRLGAALEVTSGGTLAVGQGLQLVKAAMFALPTAAVIAGVIALGAAFVAVAAEEAKLNEITERASKAASNLRGSISKAQKSVDVAVGSVDKIAGATEDASAAASDAASSVDDMATAWDNFNEQLNTNASTYRSTVSELDKAKETIDKYTGVAELSVGQQTALCDAVDKVNQACGTQYEVVDAANGVIKKQGEEAEVTAKQLDELIESQKKAALVKLYYDDWAAAQANYDEQVENYTKVQSDYNKALEDSKAAHEELHKEQEKLNRNPSRQNIATSNIQELTKKTREADAVLEGATESLEEAKNGVSTAGDNLDELNGKIENVNESAGETSDTLRDLVDSSTTLGTIGSASWDQDLRDKFSSALEDFGVTVETFKGLSSKTMADIVTNYDGSISSLVGILASHKDEFKDAGTQDAVAFAQGLSEEQLQALSSAGALSIGVVKELSKYATDANQSGSDVVDAYVKGLESGAIKNNSSVADVRTYLDKQFVSGSEESRKAGEEQGKAFADGVGSQTDEAVLAGGALMKQSVAKLGDTSDAKDAGAKVGKTYACAMTASRGNVSAAAETLGRAADGQLSKFASFYANSSGVKFGSSFSSGITTGGKSAASSASAIASSASNSLDSPWAWRSGWNLGQNFANGISATKNIVSDAAHTVANAVSAVLHHSVPETGPLHDDDVWGVHLAENFATGMLKGRGMVSRASLELANAVVEPTMSWGGGLDGGYPSAYVGAGVTYNLSIDGASVNDDPAIREQFINLMYDLKRRERSYCGQR